MRRLVACHQSVRQGGHAQPHGDRYQQIAPAAQFGTQGQGGAGHGLALGQPAQSQQKEDGGNDFDGQLRQRQIGGRKPDKGQCRGQTRAAHQNESGQTVKFGLPGSCNGADGAHDPDQCKLPTGGNWHTCAPAQPGSPQRGGGHGQAGQQKQKHLWLQALCEQLALQPARQQRNTRQHAVEGLLGIQTQLLRKIRLQTIFGQRFAQHQIQSRAAHHGQRTHDERLVDAVPNSQAVAGHIAIYHRAGGYAQQRAYRPLRRHAYGQTQKNQHVDGQAHPGHGLVRGARQIVGTWAEENIHREAQGISRGKHRCSQRGHG